jgi:uncharacterized cupin superfamily protein
MQSLPIVERWGSHPLDLRDAQGRFERSEWNYFLVDQAAGVLMGHWLAESGREDLGADEFDEALHIMSGRLTVTCEGQTYTVEAGDTVVAHRGRPMVVNVQEPVRALFICYRMEDPHGYEAMVRRAMAERGV